MKAVVPVSLDTDRDADILIWLDRQPNKSAAIREAIRETIAGITLADIYNEIQELKRRSFVTGRPEPELIEQSEAAANLDKLLSL